MVAATADAVAPPGASRGARRRAHTRAALLDAARRVVADRGVDGMTITEVADRADVAIGSFYNHFADRDDLLDEVARDAARAHAEAMAAAGASFDDPAVTVANALRATVHLAGTDPLWGRLAVRLGSGRADLGAPLVEGLAADLRAGMDAGVFPPGDVDLLVMAISGATLGVMAARLAGALDEDGEWAFAAAMLRAAGLAPAAARRAVDRLRARADDGVATTDREVVP